MMEPKVFKLKICFVGDEAVGKTSLVRRFVTGLFDEVYIRTLGAVVSKKTVSLDGRAGRPLQVDMVILDIMGKRTFMQLFKDAYFSGARGVLAVCDLTRKETLLGLKAWINGVRETVGPVPVFVLANKKDLRERIEVSDADLEDVLAGYNVHILKTSARTGENVEEAFTGLAKDIAQKDA